MSDDPKSSALQKITARAADAGPVVMSPGRALRLALPRAAEQELKMHLMVMELEEQEFDLPGLIDAIDEEAFHGLLKARDGARGLVALDPQLVAALIEVQTTGQVRTTQVSARPVTRTDAFMCENFIDQVFDLLEELLLVDGRGPWFYGYRFGNLIDDRRKLPLILEETRYLYYKISVDLGDGAKRGMLWIGLPATVRSSDRTGGLSPDVTDWQEAMKSTVMSSGVALTAVICRKQMTLAELGDLQVGYMLKIPGRKIDEIRLESADGVSHGQGKLGQVRGMRAVRVAAPQSPDLPATTAPEIPSLGREIEPDAAAQGQGGATTSPDTGASGPADTVPPEFAAADAPVPDSGPDLVPEPVPLSGGGDPDDGRPVTREPEMEV